MKFDLVRDDTKGGSTDGSTKAVFLANNLEGMPFATSWGDEFTARNQNGWLTVEDEKAPKAPETGDHRYIRVYGGDGAFIRSEDYKGDRIELTYQSAQGTAPLSPWGWSVTTYTTKRTDETGYWVGEPRRFPKRNRRVYSRGETNGPVYTGDGGYMTMRVTNITKKIQYVGIDESQLHEVDVPGHWQEVTLLKNFKLGKGGEYVQAVQEYPPNTEDADDANRILGNKKIKGVEYTYPPPYMKVWEMNHSLWRIYPRSGSKEFLPAQHGTVFDERPPHGDAYEFNDLAYDVGLIRFRIKNKWGVVLRGNHGLNETYAVQSTRFSEFSNSYYRPALIDGSATYPYPILIVPVAMTDTMTHKLIARSIDPKTGEVVRESVLFRHNALSPTVMRARRIGPKTIAVAMAFTSPYYRRGGPAMEDSFSDPEIPLETVIALYVSTDNGETWRHVKKDTLFEPHRNPPQHLPPIGGESEDHSTERRAFAYERMVMFTMKFSRVEILPLREGKALVVASRSYITDKRKGKYNGKPVMSFDIATGVLDVEANTLQQVEVLYTPPDNQRAQRDSIRYYPPFYVESSDFDTYPIYPEPWTEDNPFPPYGQTKAWMDATQRLADVAVSPLGAVVIAGVDPTEPANVTLHYYDTEGVRRQTVPIPAKAYLAGSAVGDHDGRFRFTVGPERPFDIDDISDKVYRLSWTPRDGFQDKDEMVNGVRIDAISKLHAAPPEQTRPTGAMYSLMDPPLLYYGVRCAFHERCIQFNGKWLPMEPAPAWVYK